MLAMNRSPALLLASFFVFPLLAFSSNCPTNCSNIPIISYPFGAATGCGLPGFQLDCTPPSVAKWNLQLNASMESTSYFVQGIDNQLSHGAVNLNLYMKNPNADSDNICIANFSVTDPGMNYNLFGGANLSGFTQANLTFSESNVYLLLGCKNPPVPIPEAQYCSPFETSCSYETEKCVLFKPVSGNYIEPDLQKQYEEYQCTSYTTVVTSEPAIVNTSSTFQPGIQLSWTQPQFYSNCSACQNSNGTCGYKISDKSFLCFCDNNQAIETDCSHIGSRAGCIGRLCTTLAKGLVFGVTAGIGLASIALVIVYFVRKRRTKPRGSERRGSSNKFVTERGKSFAAQFGPVSAREYSFKELEHATESFADDKMLGDGRFGAVYEGRLYDNRKVAVKRLYHDNFRRMDQFYNEIRILSSLRHSNLVKLYGYCCEDDRDLLLVFEYVSNGTVADHVHNPDAKALPWEIRLKIALETAEALSYLHNDMSPPIYHRDVKSTNILLEQDFQVKLADFGLSRLVPLQVTHVSTVPQGTPGYLDPDYHQSYQLTDKSDVYSFGVVLMELISSLPAVDMARSRGEINLSSLAVSKIVCGAWQELVDSRLQIDREPHVEAMVRSVVELAFRCLDSEKDNRPNMEEVAKELANIKESGYRDLNSQSSINISLCTKETSRLINPKVAPSPTSDQSPWLSSNVSYISSDNSGSYLLNSRRSAP